MKKDLKELVFILDRSGSMCGLENDTIGGFNSLIAEQQNQEGDCFVTTVLFDNEIQTIHDRTKLDKIKPMSDGEYFARGSTALLDAIGVTIKHIEKIHKYARKEDVPKKTLFIITTDGQENASNEFSVDEIKKMIQTKKTKCDWEFIFMGANIDAIEVAQTFGLSDDRAVTFKNDSVGIRKNYDTLCDIVSSLRIDEEVSPDWKSIIEEYNSK